MIKDTFIYQNFFTGRLTLFLLTLPLGVLLGFPNFFGGLLIGIYLSWIIFFYICVSNPITKRSSSKKKKNDFAKKTCEKIKIEEISKCIYKGWMNILNDHYNPHNFHVNTIQTVLVCLDGNLLRISKPECSLYKHAFHTDRSLTDSEPKMISQSIYDLTNASVKLRPKRLAPRRWFSRKYPICITLNSPIPNLINNEKSRLIATEPFRSKCYCRHVHDFATVNNSSISLNLTKDKSLPLLKSYTNVANCKSLKNFNDDSNSDDIEIFNSGTNLNKTDKIIIGHSVTDYNFLSKKKQTKFFSDDSDTSEKTISSLKFIKKQQRVSIQTTNVTKSQKIFLFARSAREKERWFHRLRNACSKYILKNSNNYLISNSDNLKNKNKKVNSLKDFSSINWKNNLKRQFLSLPNLNNYLKNEVSKNYWLYLLNSVQFSKHLENILPEFFQHNSMTENDVKIVYMDLGRNLWKKPEYESINSEFIVVINLLVSRIFFDFCRDNYWCKAVQQKIQTKLTTIHLPYFIEILELSNFDIGTAIPQILNVYKAIVDDWGIWIDFEIKYNGLIKLMLETKFNLMKLTEHNDALEKKKDLLISHFLFSTSIERSYLRNYSDNEIPESPETSPDEQFGIKNKIETRLKTPQKKTGKKLLNLVNKITHSKYFEKASELKPIRKVMKEISSTRLVLNVEITLLEGTMTINIPPPPSDRLWWGFRQPPKMSIKAVPQVGECSVAVSAISEWIESKIQLLLEKSFVYPNLVDFVLPVMSGNTLLTDGLNM